MNPIFNFELYILLCLQRIIVIWNWIAYLNCVWKSMKTNQKNWNHSRCVEPRLRTAPCLAMNPNQNDMLSWVIFSRWRLPPLWFSPTPLTMGSRLFRSKSPSAILDAGEHGFEMMESWDCEIIPNFSRILILCDRTHHTTIDFDKAHVGGVAMITTADLVATKATTFEPSLRWSPH